MKIRSGFVSNSSSSSFIIGLGIVEDEEKFVTACREKGLKINDNWESIQIKPLSQIKEEANRWSGPSVRGDTLELESFTYSYVTLNCEGLGDDTKIAIMDMTGELDDDSDFWNEWEYEYDKSPTEGDYDKMSVFSESCGIKNGSTAGGAGRNG